MMAPRTHTKLRIIVASLLCLCSLGVASVSDWRQHVPESDRARANPYALDADAVSIGKKLFQQSCAQCHGDDANGRTHKPSLRSEDVRTATDGELFWLLTNGSVRHGMPSWSRLPESQRWQIIAFLRSFNRAAAASHQGTTKSATIGK